MGWIRWIRSQEQRGGSIAQLLSWSAPSGEQDSHRMPCACSVIAVTDRANPAVTDWDINGLCATIAMKPNAKSSRQQRVADWLDT
jgi:hypothetical protein